MLNGQKMWITNGGHANWYVMRHTTSLDIACPYILLLSYYFLLLMYYYMWLFTCVPSKVVKLNNERPRRIGNM